MPRFFTPSDGISDDVITIKGDDAHHIARSLRMAEGDEITVCDMHGFEHTCRLVRIRDEECECQIISSKKGETEPPVHITLYMAYPKGDKLETVVQKAVELGACEIIPFESSRCIKRPKADRIEKQLGRLNKIAEEAAKQCGRATLPEVKPTLSYPEMLKEAKKADLSLFCYEAEDRKSLKEALEGADRPSSISIVVGSEGGFSPEEARAAAEAGLTSVTLGPRILRCETAPDYALSAISYRFEL